MNLQSILLFRSIAVGALVQLINDGPNPLLFISGSKFSCLNEQIVTCGEHNFLLIGHFKHV
jgi:hypothetical protein